MCQDLTSVFAEISLEPFGNDSPLAMTCTLEEAVTCVLRARALRTEGGVHQVAPGAWGLHGGSSDYSISWVPFLSVTGATPPVRPGFWNLSRLLSLVQEMASGLVFPWELLLTVT